MMFEHSFDIGIDCDRLHGIAKQIAGHANIACMLWFDDHGKVRQGRHRRLHVDDLRGLFGLEQ